jgi:hypothetical protein
VKLSPQRLSALTLRILEAEGMRVFDCSRCGESKIGPNDMTVCRTCQPAQRTKPLAKRRKAPGICGYGHAIEGANARTPKGKSFSVCVMCERRYSRAYAERKKREREALACVARQRCVYGTPPFRIQRGE